MGALQSQPISQDKKRVLWLFEHSPNQFHIYPDDISTTVERYFLSNYKKPFQVKTPDNQQVTIDLSQMTQTGYRPGVTSRIMRELNQQPKLNVVWNWETDWGDFMPYEAGVSAQIEAFYQKPEINFSHIMIGDQEFWIDLKNHNQVSVASMKKRRIERSTIPDESFVWQWQSNNGRFLNYAEHISKKIEAEYFLRSDNPPKITMQGRNYFIDVRRFCEIDELDGQVRQIRRVPESYIRYKWLWQDEEGKWNTFSNYLAEKIEENYLDPDKGPFLVIINYTQFEIDTMAMMEKSVVSGKIYKIKRQAMSNDFAVWGWVSKSRQFTNFPPSTSKKIEAHYLLNDPSPLTVNVGGKQYAIQIRLKTMMNPETRTHKKLERRFVTNCYPPDLDPLPKTECLKVFKFLTRTGNLPEDWNHHQKEEIQIYSGSDIEWNIVSEKFFKTMEANSWVITSLLRVQNIMSVNYFLLEKARIQSIHSFGDPKLLFYIPNKQDDLESLYNNIENSLEGNYSPLEDFGKGYYFTDSVKLCNEYAWEKEGGHKVIICFWVLVGRVAKAKPEDNVPIMYQNKYQSWKDVKKPPKGSDSCKGVIQGEDVFVIYNAERCYPLYVIEYDQMIGV